MGCCACVGLSSCVPLQYGASVEERPVVACPSDANVVISLQFEVVSCTSRKL